MKLNTEKKIIKNAVNESWHPEVTREFVARQASIIAHKKGVNVLAADYLHDMLCDELDQHHYHQDDYDY